MSPGPGQDATPAVDYDGIAEHFDERYARNDYAEVEEFLGGFVAPGQRVLEVGCGTGHWLEWMGRRGCRVAGLDASRGMLRRAQRAGRAEVLAHGRAEGLPWRPGSFDRVVCVNALHHFDDKPRFLAEAYRVLAPGGGLVSFGIDPHEERDHWCIYDYFEGTREVDRRRYPPTAALRTWLSEAGFARCETRVGQHRAFRAEAREALASGRFSQHNTSQLALLERDAYDRGIARIEADARRAEARGDSLVLEADLRIWATTAWRTEDA